MTVFCSIFVTKYRHVVLAILKTNRSHCKTKKFFHVCTWKTCAYNSACFRLICSELFSSFLLIGNFDVVKCLAHVFGCCLSVGAPVRPNMFEHSLARPCPTPVRAETSVRRRLSGNGRTVSEFYVSRSQWFCLYIIVITITWTSSTSKNCSWSTVAFVSWHRKLFDCLHESSQVCQ